MRALLRLSAGCAFASLVVTTHANAQARTSGSGEIKGRLVEAGTGRAITAGSITIRRAADTSIVTGGLPRADGSFQLTGIAAGRYSLHVRSLGYAPLVRSEVTVSAAAPVVDVGTLTLSPIAVQLAKQDVVAERSDVALSPDRNSYSVKNMATVSGGTAIDALRNTPSVEVDGQNKVSLRGNENVVVQINGRATPLKGEQLGNFLAQIPASNVSKIEVATNPSAKDDPEGTAGIINIVLTEKLDVGLSGGFTMGTGTTGLANISGNVGRQSGPSMLFASYNFFRESRDLAWHSERDMLDETSPAFVLSRTGGQASPRSQNLTLRSEYKLGEHDAISADAILSGGLWQRKLLALNTDLDPTRDVLASTNQLADQRSRSATQDITAAYRRTGGPEATTFSTELRFARNGWSSQNVFSNFIALADGSSGALSGSPQRDESNAVVPTWTLQSDYTHPFGTARKLEAGFKGISRNTTDDITPSTLDLTSGQFVPVAGASAFDYHEQIGAVYAVYSQRVNKVQGQAGLRLEEAATRLDLSAPYPSYDKHYGSLFPSASVTYNPTDMQQVKLSYSRRISRPDPFQLSPIPWYDDARSIYRGNPEVQPEYTDAFELGLQQTTGWGSVQINPYVRKTAHAVRFIRYVDANGISISTVDNVASTITMGTDLNATYKVGNLNFFGGGSAFHYHSDASNISGDVSPNAGDLSTTAFFWSLRANATYKLTPQTDVQVSSNYRAPFRVEGGSLTAFAFTNLSVRQKIWGDQGGITLRVVDPFNTMSFGFQTADGHVVESQSKRYGMRGVFLSVNRMFGQQPKLQARPQEQEQTGPPTGP
ncbi:MAG TPA: TonB-dependent receptor [Gemmatimonadaceae bacterium]